MRSLVRTALRVALPFLALSLPAAGETTFTLKFENSGLEAGLTPPGASSIRFLGASLSGGTVATQGIPSLYASGAYSYHPAPTGAEVVFERPVDEVSFFFVHLAGTPAGTATLLDASGALITTFQSHVATFFGDPANFVSALTFSLSQAQAAGALGEVFPCTTP